MSDTLKVYPVFSSPIAVFDIEQDLNFYYEKLKTFYNFKTVYPKEYLEHSDIKNTWISESYVVFKDFPDLEKIILKYFYNYKNKVLKYENTDFVFTTSWVTKVEVPSYHPYHPHHNSMFSGCLYFDDGSPIEFHPSYNPLIAVNNPTENNIYNSLHWEIETKKNRLIFFPSYLLHRISSNHLTNDTRYSLVFNILPTGTFSTNTAIVNVDVKDIDWDTHSIFNDEWLKKDEI